MSGAGLYPGSTVLVQCVPFFSFLQRHHGLWKVPPLSGSQQPVDPVPGQQPPGSTFEVSSLESGGQSDSPRVAPGTVNSVVL